MAAPTSESSGIASLTFTHTEDLEYLLSNQADFEQAVGGEVVSSDKNTRTVRFKYKVVITIALFDVALTMIVNRFFPFDRYKTTEVDELPYQLEFHEAKDVASNTTDARHTFRFTVKLVFANEEDQAAFFDEGLRLCIARRVNSAANTCWVALERNSFENCSATIGWDDQYVFAAIDETVAKEGGVLGPPGAHSAAITFGQTVTSDKDGHWKTPDFGNSSQLGVVNEAEERIYVSLNQQCAGDSVPKPICASSVPVTAQPAKFTVQQQFYAWASHSVVQGTVTTHSYTNHHKFTVTTQAIPILYISAKDEEKKKWHVSEEAHLPGNA